MAQDGASALHCATRGIIESGSAEGLPCLLMILGVGRPGFGGALGRGWRVLRTAFRNRWIAAWGLRAAARPAAPARAAWLTPKGYAGAVDAVRAEVAAMIRAPDTVRC